MSSNMKPVPMSSAHILLPNKEIDMTRWAVIACDQFTSHPAYWQSLREDIKDLPSTLHMILPEAELATADEHQIKTINDTINTYVSSNVLTDVGDIFVLVERKTAYGNRRLGLLATVDLEHYGFLPQSRQMIRATEDTIISRIPPRVMIRRDAKLELTHTMVLVNDEQERLINTIDRNKDIHDVLYDFDLNMDGGHVTGYRIRDIKGVIAMFQALVKDEEDPLIFVVGDGNHSLAAAKTHWDHLKSTLTPRELKDHPARHALVEIVSLYDEGLSFEGIHRVIFDVDHAVFLEQLRRVMEGKGTTNVVCEGILSPLRIPDQPHEAYERLQIFMKGYLADHPKARIDYVHGDDEVRRITIANPHALGILMPKLKRRTLFETIKAGRVLPLKSFSIGHATEKRYYIEARAITKDQTKEN